MIIQFSRKWHRWIFRRNVWHGANATFLPSDKNNWRMKNRGNKHKKVWKHNVYIQPSWHYVKSTDYYSDWLCGGEIAGFRYIMILLSSLLHVF